jgi:OTU-like cysteine protease
MTAVSSSLYTAAAEPWLSEPALKSAFEEQHVLGDGNCLFRALSDQLDKDEGDNHVAVRKAICDYIEQDPATIFSSLADVATTPGGLAGYVTLMRADKTFGTDIEVYAASCVYQANITVFSDQESGTLVRNLFAPVSSDDQEGDLRQLYLRVYLKRSHYSSLRLSSSKSPSPSSCREVQRLRCLEVDIDRERILYTIAAVHLKSNYNWKLYLPTLVLSLVASILAFLQAAVSLDKTDKKILAGAIGILGIVSSTLLEVARRLQLETRATIYANVAVKLTIIMSDLRFHPLDSADVLKVLHDKIRRDYQKAKEESKSELIPHRITSAFEALDAYIKATFCPAVELKVGVDPHAPMHKIDTDEVRQCLYEELSAFYGSYYLFPIHLPNAEWAKWKTVSRYKNKLLRDLPEVARNTHGRNLLALSVKKAVYQRQWLMYADEEMGDMTATVQTGPTANNSKGGTWCGWLYQYLHRKPPGSTIDTGGTYGTVT